MRHQLKKPVQSVHLAAAINRPLTPQQPSWQGSPPPGVDAILTRDALAEHFRDGYVSWASNFALLRSDYVTENFQAEAARIRAQRASHRWQHFKFYDMYYCDTGDDHLWLTKQDAGWTIEIDYSDPKRRVLTTANMPVLCPDMISAARLALVMRLGPRITVRYRANLRPGRAVKPLPLDPLL